MMRAERTRSSGMGVCLPVAVTDWAAAGAGPKETYTAGNGEPRRELTPEEVGGQGWLLERSVFVFVLLFLAPSRFHTLFYASWRLRGREPGSETETLADSPSGLWGTRRARAQGRRSSRGGRGSRVGGALCADLSPLRLIKTRIPGEDRPGFLFALVPPPNLSETFENKVLFVPPPRPPHHIITQLWSVDVRSLMARRAGRGARRRRQELPGTICRRLAFLWSVPSRLEPQAGGLGGWVW